MLPNITDQQIAFWFNNIELLKVLKKILKALLGLTRGPSVVLERLVPNGPRLVCKDRGMESY